MTIHTTSLEDNFFAIVRVPGLDELDAGALRHLLQSKGAVLIKGACSSMDEFATLCTSLHTAPMPPGGDREQMHPKNIVYGVEPGTHANRLHYEAAFSPLRPDLVFIYCERPASSGGQTLISDGVRVFSNLGQAVQERLIQEPVIYRSAVHARGWHTLFPGLSLPEIRFVLDRVVEIVAEAGQQISYELDDELLRFEYVTSSVIRNHRNAEVVYSDSGCVFDTELDDSPIEFSRTRSFFSDREPIPEWIRGAVLDSLARCATPIEWEPGDVLLLDNWSVPHGRHSLPDDGSRRLLISYGYADWLRPASRPAAYRIFL